ncbi:Nucleotide-diphospho-sugar transferase [Fusarium oxysporum f. sp. vasinfectum]|nr:Nucleotide-diphospho-sugar transferase [Fusarium oxysporum f. sp. vasinfectum]
MLFEALEHLRSRADRVMIYPSHMLGSDHKSSNARLLAKARDKYDVKLVPITVRHKDNTDPTWADSLTKLLLFNQTQYSRILYIDSDSVLLESMDELFFMPSIPVAMPRAYWLFPMKEILSTMLMLIEPSEVEFARIMSEMDAASSNDYDIEIINSLYRNNAMVLPHRRYALLTGEFRSESHAKYLGSEIEPWDPARAYSEAKLVHFSDWPLPKPWLHIDEELRLELQPNCTNTTGDVAEHHEARYPGVVVEVALTQDAKELRRIARRYIYYTGGQIKVVLGIDLNEDKESTISVWKPTFSSAQNGDGVGMDIEQVVQPQPFRDAKKNPEVPEPSIRVVNKRRYSESPEDLMTEEDEKRYSDDADDANDKEDHDDGAYKPPKNLENMTFEPHKKRDQGASRGDCS